MSNILKSDTTKIYFRGLDSMRFIAISFVVLHHFFTFRNYYDTEHIIEFPIIGRIGYYGIQFFFAGSGFLITYLLLAEKTKYGNISLKKFYLRRILRIWPAYYSTIFIGLVIVLQIEFFNIPSITNNYLNADYSIANLLYFLFMPHFAGALYPTAPYVHQTYTIGMEEQFYFLWGMMFVLIFRRLKVVFWIFLLLLPSINALLQNYGQNGYLGNSLLVKGITTFFYFVCYFRIPTFALGSLWAYSYFQNAGWLKIFQIKWFQLLCFALFVLSVYFNFSIPIFGDEYMALLTLCVFSSVMHEKSIINLEVGWLKYLGKISYGIYLYHIFSIVLSIKLAMVLFSDISEPAAIIFLVITVMASSIFLGWLSYITVESYFLRIKKRLARV